VKEELERAGKFKDQFLSTMSRQLGSDPRPGTQID
jgi:hypothetical protein